MKTTCVCRLLAGRLFVILCAVSIRPWAVARESHGSQTSPDAILFVTDKHGLDALGCYGNSVIQTPYMDRLADEGVKFTRAYCTSSSCAASRSVRLTGQYGHATGSYGHVHDYHHFSSFDSVESFPVLLAAGEYYTTRVGKYHIAPDSVYRFQTVLDAESRRAAAHFPLHFHFSYSGAPPKVSPKESL